MTSFDQRENAYEAEFAHQEDLKFRARERAVKNLATWAAGRLGKAGDALEAYAREVVASDVSNPSLEVTIERIAEALAPKGVDRIEIRQMMDRLTAAADAAVRSRLPPSR